MGGMGGMGGDFDAVEGPQNATRTEKIYLTQLSCITIYRNLIAILPQPSVFLMSIHSILKSFSTRRRRQNPSAPSVLAWPAWRRVLAVVPAVALLWLAVWWASLEAAPW